MYYNKDLENFCDTLIISRAILAGFNTSNVDIRSSCYESIIDNERK